ncbi:MAG: serine/threonine protein kinase [Candidatus Obscuribacterales bacterium]|nr:serine/threonine protein kinase [Candidatus Obscuribacterales bacterium]
MTIDAEPSHMLIELQPGSVFDDRYEIIQLIAQGGMGSVYKARELELNRLVAVKLLQPSLMVDSEYYSRFRLEGAVLSRLSHPGIVNFYRFGVWQERVAYIVMEMVEGRSLRSELDEQGALSSARAAEIGIQLCSAIDAAHKQNVVHRDLKPDNIILIREADGEFVKVIDFGLARLVSGANAQHLTQTGMLIGSVYYMSPEQCTGKPADARSDIYSLGCVLYEAVSGGPPFHADNPIGLMSLHVNKAAPPVTRETLPDARLWDVVLAKAMAKDPEARYASMAEFARDLDLLRAGKILTDPSVRAHKKRSFSFPVLVVASGLFCLVLIGAGLLVVGRRSRSESAQAVLRANSRAKTVRPSTRISPEWIYDYRLHREKIGDDCAISALNAWVEQHGDRDLEGEAIAHFWICLEHVGNANDIIYSHANHGPRYVMPRRNVFGGQAQKERARALSLLRKSLREKPKPSIARDNILYYEMVLRALDVPDSERIKICQAILNRKAEIGPRFSNELRLELIRIYRRSGDYKSEEKLIQELLDDTSTPSLMLAENYLRQGKGTKARLSAELHDMTHNNWSQFNKRLIHYCGQLLFVDGQPDSALKACHACDEDEKQRHTDDFFLRETRVCLSTADHAVLESNALHAQGKDKEAAAALKRAEFPDSYKRINMLAAAVSIARKVGVAPSVLLQPVLVQDLKDEDVIWATAVANDLREYDPATASILRTTALNLMKRSLKRSVKSDFLDRVLSMLSTAGMYSAQSELIDAAMRNLAHDDHSERRMAIEMLRVRSLIDSGEYSEASRLLAPVIAQVRAKDFKFSQEYIVEAVSLEARLLITQHREEDARRLYMEMFKKYRDSHDLSVKQKLALLNSLARLSQQRGDARTLNACRSDIEKLKSSKLNPLIDVDFER